jgi:hypothetical protein
VIRRFGLACFAVLVAVTIYGETAKRVSMRVRAVGKDGKPHERIGFAGQGLRLTTLIPQNADNRYLAVIIDCENYTRSWQEQLDGEQAPYSRESTVGPMPPGWCLVGAQVAFVDPTKDSGIGYAFVREDFCFIGGDISCQ